MDGFDTNGSTPAAPAAPTPAAAPPPAPKAPGVIDRIEAAVMAFVGNYARMGWVGLVAVGLAVAIVMLADQQIMVGVWKMAMVAAGAFGGYWLDRHAFPYARPHALGADDAAGVWTKYDPMGIVFATCMARRAVIMAAAMIAVGIAL